MRVIYSKAKTIVTQFSEESSQVQSSPSRTQLHALHCQLKAKMVNFSGWHMPVQYRGISEEHRAVRQSVGVFDISHMGKFELVGDNLIASLSRLVPSSLDQLSPGDAQYTVLLNPDGGIVDDLIIYYHENTSSGKQKMSLIVNAATTEKDRTWLQTHLSETEAELQDFSRDRILLAVQGPQAESVLQSFVADDLSSVGRYKHITTDVLGTPGFLARTGYTGEDGFEVMVSPDTGTELWQTLLAKGVTPCGLGARDTLRLEAAMGLYGQDVDDSTSPLEAGLKWLVHLDRKGDFVGRSALESQLEEGLSRRLVCLEMQGRNIARHGYRIMQDEQPIGVVTSGTLSPTLGKPIALGYVPPKFAKSGQTVSIEIRGKLYPAQVVKRPFYKSN